MNVKEFCKARERFLNLRAPIINSKGQSTIDTIVKAAKPQHVFKNNGSGVFDQAICSCGWKGSNFMDGDGLAINEWLNHVADAMGLIPKKCVCGKLYIPADGGKPCHKVVKNK